MRLVTAALVAATATFLTANSEAQEVLRIESEHLFVPGGFDDNDNIQVVLNGAMDRTCDRLISPHWELDAATRQIYVSARVLRNHDTVCMEQIRPFTQSIDLGVLPMGEYRVWTNGGRLAQTLAVTEAQSAGEDDEYYAYLTDAYVEYNEDLEDGYGKWSVVLKGYFEDHCQEWDYIELEVSTNMFEVFPVVTAPSLECPQELEVFTKRVYLPQITLSGRYLVHVRSRHGEALNDVFSVPDES